MTIYTLLLLSRMRDSLGDDGDSIDRERVRDFLVRNYGYSKEFDGGSLCTLDQEQSNEQRLHDKYVI